jgi:DNA-directed RNA polymerase subunit RPC12/RpoP
MSLSFNCPQCKAHIQVADDMAGQSGQCPRCEHIFVIPSPSQPLPAKPRSTPTAEKVPPSDPWAKTESRKDDKRAEGPARRRRRTPAPTVPSGPVWPWILGVAGALVIGVLLLSSFFVLVLWRRPEPPIQIDPHTEVKVDFRRPIAGRIEGQRAFLEDGVFQIRTALEPNDPADPQEFNCKCKRYEIELRGDRTYMIEQDSVQFAPFVRVENINRQQFGQNGMPGVRNTHVRFAPPQTGIYIVYASCVDPAFGEFTLTIRDANVAKPFVP